MLFIKTQKANYNLVTELTITNHKKAFFLLLFLLLVFCFIKEILLQDQEIFPTPRRDRNVWKKVFLIIFLRILKIGMRACHIGLIHKRRKKKNILLPHFYVSLFGMEKSTEWKKERTWRHSCDYGNCWLFFLLFLFFSFLHSWRKTEKNVQK